MTGPLPPSVTVHPRNSGVLTFLDGKSSHSDNFEVLWKAIQGLPGAQMFSPDTQQYLYGVAATNNIVFGASFSMSHLLLRLPSHTHAPVIALGAVARPDVGDDWVALKLWFEPTFSGDVASWTRQAYLYVRSWRR